MAATSFIPSHQAIVNSFSSSQFANREEAGQILAELLRPQRDYSASIVLALPRGGMLVARQIADRFQIPLDIFLVRKITMPTLPDIVIGTVTSGGLHSFELPYHGDPALLNESLLREQAELQRRELSYRLARPAQNIAGRSVIVVDDGLTTGLTMRAAIRSLRELNATHITAAIPVGSAGVCAQLEMFADSVVCARKPNSLTSVRRYYRDYSPVLDSDIRELLASSQPHSGAHGFRA